MLQWMGGSRRKVTTESVSQPITFPYRFENYSACKLSRKSTQKRKKQYFEQRKRQQQEQDQEHNIGGLESYSDKKLPHPQYHENNRSLDVISLLNLSKHGQDCTSRFPEGRGGSNIEHTTPNYRTAHCPNTIKIEIKNSCRPEHVELKETRIASNQVKKTVCPHDLHLDASKRNNAKYPMKASTDHKLSLIDLFGDDGQNSSSKGNFEHENHVAFSVEGLGKVEMETPVRSPQNPTRKFSHGCPAPSKTSKGSHSSKKLSFSPEDQFSAFDSMAFGADIPTGACSLELPPYLKIYGNSKQKKMIDKEPLLHDVKDILSNDAFYDRRVEQDEYNWHEKSCFLDDRFHDDSSGLSWKNWECDLDSSMENRMGSRNCDKPDFSFEDIHTQKRRASAKAACSFNISEVSSPYKHQMEYRYDFASSDMTSYPTTRRNSDYSELTYSSAWPSFATEDARDHLSFLRHLYSDDSCLSQTVWCERTKNPSFNSAERQKIREDEAVFGNPVNYFTTKKNTFTQDFCTKRPNTWQQESYICSGRHNRMSDFSTPGDNWLFEEQCNIETQKASPFGPFVSDFNPKFYVDEKPSTSRSDHDAFSGNLFSDKVAFCKEVSPDHSSHIIKSINVECGHQESFNDLFKQEKDFSNLQFQESDSIEETKSVTLPAISSTLHQHEDNRQQSNNLSSANGTPMNVLDYEDNQSQFEVSNVKTPEMTPRPNVLVSPVRSEWGSSSVEMPQNLEESDGLKKRANGTQTSLLSQNEHEENSGHGKGNLIREETLNNVDRPCIAVMPGRFVLQLL